MGKKGRRGLVERRGGKLGGLLGRGRGRGRREWARGEAG